MTSRDRWPRQPTESDWERVGAAIRQRMAQLRMLQADLVRRSGISDMTIRPLQNGEPGNYRDATLASVAVALDWPYDAIQRILAGDEPDSFDTVKTVDPPPAPATQAKTYRERIDALPPEARGSVERMIEAALELAEGEHSRGSNGNAMAKL